MRHLEFIGRVFLALTGVLFVAAAIYMLVSANLAFADIGGVIGFFTPIVGTSGFGICLVYFSLPKRAGIEF
jgi:hypothetical protein